MIQTFKRISSFLVDSATDTWMLYVETRDRWAKEARDIETRYQESLPKFKWAIIPPMNPEMKELLDVWNQVRR